MKILRLSVLRYLPVCGVAASLVLATGCGLSNDNDASARPVSGSPQSGSGTEAQSGSEPEMVRVQGREYRETVDLPGASVRGFERTQVKAKLGGYVRQIGSLDGQQIDIGSKVRQGTTLAILDIPEMEDDIREKTALVEQAQSAVAQADAAINEAQAEVRQKQAVAEQTRSHRAEKEALLRLAETRLERVSSLAVSGVIGAENIDEARYRVDAAMASLASIEADVKAADTSVRATQAKLVGARADKSNAVVNVKVAQARLNRLQTLAKYATITAPFDGIITRRMIDHGDLVLPGENNSAAMPVFEITRIDRVRVTASVPTAKVGSIEPGQPVVFHSIGGLPGRAFEGVITRSAGALDSTRKMPIEVDFTNPVTDVHSGEAIVLTPGRYGTLTVVRREWGPDNTVPVVPTSAMGTDDHGQTFVVVRTTAGFERRTVRIAFNDAINVGISDGLAVGEQVVDRNPGAYQ